MNTASQIKKSADKKSEKTEVRLNKAITLAI
jgi:hypothetical protein